MIGTRKDDKPAQDNAPQSLPQGVQGASSGKNQPLLGFDHQDKLIRLECLKLSCASTNGTMGLQNQISTARAYEKWIHEGDGQ